MLQTSTHTCNLWSVIKMCPFLNLLPFVPSHSQWNLFWNLFHQRLLKCKKLFLFPYFLLRFDLPLISCEEYIYSDLTWNGYCITLNDYDPEQRRLSIFDLISSYQETILSLSILIKLLITNCIINQFQNWSV